MNRKIDQSDTHTVRPIAGSLLVAGALFCFGLMSGHAQAVDANTSLTYVLCLRPNEYVQDQVGDESQINVEPWVGLCPSCVLALTYSAILS